MWFRMPKEIGSISVQQQQFAAVFSDDSGGYFQAPDHFAPEILGLKGFETCDRPKGVPRNIANMEPKRDVALKNLGDQVTSLNATVTDLRTSLNALNADLRAAQTRNNDLLQQMAEKTAECAALRERLAEHEDEKETNDALAKQNNLPTILAKDDDENDEDDD